MLLELRPQEGDTVLELAAGVGETGFEAAALVGETGKLITTDFSPAMLEAARRRGTELGLANVDYRVIDAERIELHDDSRRGALPVRVHADGGSSRGATGDSQSPAPRRSADAGGLGRR